MNSLTGIFLILIILFNCYSTTFLTVNQEVSSPTDEQKENNCSQWEEWDDALNDLKKNTDKLIEQFNKHARKYDKRSNKAVSLRNQEINKTREDIYLNDFMQQAKSISDVINDLKLKLNEFKATSCGKNDEEHNVIEAELAATTLIQLIMKRYEYLGLKLKAD